MIAENVRLKFRLGDTWGSPVWAVLVHDQPVDLEDDWLVRVQARRRPEDAPVHEWTVQNGGLVLGRATVEYTSTQQTVETSTIQMVNSAYKSATWLPFSADFEVEISRGTGAQMERFTVVRGRISGLEDVTE